MTAPSIDIDTIRRQVLDLLKDSDFSCSVQLAYEEDAIDLVLGIKLRAHRRISTGYLATAIDAHALAGLIKTELQIAEADLKDECARLAT